MISTIHAFYGMREVGNTRDDNITLKTNRVLTFGEPLVVCVPHRRGALTYVRGFDTDYAGAELNTAIGLARLQIPVAYAACVGADPFGDFIHRALLAESVDCTCLQKAAKSQTGVFFKEWSGLDNSSNVYYYRSVSPMATGSWDTQGVSRLIEEDTFSWVHATGITWMIGETTRTQAGQIIRLAHSRGIPISFDVNLRLKLGSLPVWRQVIYDILPYVTWLFIGDAEAVSLFGTHEPLSVDQLARGQGFKGEGIIIKRGAEGASIARREKVIDVSALPVHHVVDTVGAGDGFNAGWIAGMLRGWSLERALQLGTLVGAYAVTSPGDSSGYPDWGTAVQALNGKRVVSR